MFCCHGPLLALSLALTGCDLTGQYEKKFQEAVQTSGQRAVFDQNLHPDFTEVGDAGVKLRLPKLFDMENRKELTAKDPRAIAPFALPGLTKAIERQFDDTKDPPQFLPAYIYLAAQPKGDQKADAFQAQVAQLVGATVRGATWSDVTLPTPSGQSIALKRLRAEGQQPFVNIQKNAPAAVDGLLDIYYIDGGNHHVLIGWRIPKAQAQKYQIQPAIEAAMGTVETTAPPTTDAGGKSPPG
jgi:hypothetical protein